MFAGSCGPIFATRCRVHVFPSSWETATQSEKFAPSNRSNGTYSQCWCDEDADVSATIGPLIHSCGSFGSGHAVGVSSGAPPMFSARAANALQVEAPQSTAVVAGVFVPPSSVLLTRTMLAPVKLFPTSPVVSSLNVKKTSLPSVAFSSVATHCRSSIAPTFDAQPRSFPTHVSPRSRETFIVTHAPERSTKKTLCVTCPTAWCESPPPPPVTAGWLKKYGLCGGTRKVWPPSDDL